MKMFDATVEVLMCVVFVLMLLQPCCYMIRRAYDTLVTDTRKKAVED